MLKITVSENRDAVTFAMEGRWCAAWAGEAREAWERLRSSLRGRAVILDLAEVTYIDREGELLLSEILAHGATVHSTGVLIGHIVDRAQQRVRPGSGSTEPRKAVPVSKP